MAFFRYCNEIPPNAPLSFNAFDFEKGDILEWEGKTFIVFCPFSFSGLNEARWECFSSPVPRTLSPISDEVKDKQA